MSAIHVSSAAARQHTAPTTKDNKTQSISLPPHVAAAKTECAQEDKRNAREGKAEKRRQAKLKRAERQAKVRGPWRSSQPSPANPAMRVENHEESSGMLEPESAGEELANELSPLLETGTEKLARETALAPCAREDGSFGTSTSNSNTLIDKSASSSVTNTCDIDTTEDCHCDECLNYDLAVDLLEGGPPGEKPFPTENAIEILSSKPRPYRSTSFVDELELLASCSVPSENKIPRCQVPNNAFASQHNLIDGLVGGVHLKSKLNVRAPSFVPKTVSTGPKTQPRTNRLPSVSEFLSWVELGLTAEANHESLFSRVWQLRSLGCLTQDDEKVLGFIISRLWKQMYLATQNNPNKLKEMSIPSGSGSWVWSDFQLSAEDREDSIFGITKKLASLGFWSIYDEKALHSITMTVARKWLVASSEEDTPSAASFLPALPMTNSDQCVRKFQNTSGVPSLQQLSDFVVGRHAVAPSALTVDAYRVHKAADTLPTRPLPGIYRDGKLIASDAILHD